jgi:hypothetical protein
LWPVKRITGTRLSAGRERNFLHTSIPLWSGRTRSSRIASGGRLVAFSIASLPVVAWSIEV